MGEGSREKQDIDIIDGILDDQIEKFPTGAQVHRLRQGVPIKMVSTDIEFLYEGSVNTGIMVLAIATVDGVYYAALCDGRSFPPTGYVEEIQMTPGRRDIKTVRLIMSPEEWNVLTDFFQRNNVWEKKRIFNWIWKVKNGMTIVNDEWIDRINKDMKRNPLTKDELISGSTSILDSGTKR